MMPISTAMVRTHAAISRATCRRTVMRGVSPPRSTFAGATSRYDDILQAGQIIWVELDAEPLPGRRHDFPACRVAETAAHRIDSQHVGAIEIGKDDVLPRRGEVRRRGDADAALGHAADHARNARRFAD